jgi:hypothetical protein
MTRHPETHIVAPAAWASYLINGDASGLSRLELTAAQAWLRREGVRIVGIEPGAESYFCAAGRVHVPELDADGFDALDYRAEELTITESLT